LILIFWFSSTLFRAWADGLMRLGGNAFHSQSSELRKRKSRLSTSVQTGREGVGGTLGGWQRKKQ
jgi:hypothetical protein